MNHNDPYIELINERWSSIMLVYATFKNKKPIIEYDVTEGKIFSYPAEEYIGTLSVRTREQTRQQYRKTLGKNQFILFVKDTRKRVLRSYIFDL